MRGHRTQRLCPFQRLDWSRIERADQPVAPKNGQSSDLLKRVVISAMESRRQISPAQGSIATTGESATGRASFAAFEFHGRAAELQKALFLGIKMLSTTSDDDVGNQHCAAWPAKKFRSITLRASHAVRSVWHSKQHQDDVMKNRKARRPESGTTRANDRGAMVRSL